MKINGLRRAFFLSVSFNKPSKTKLKWAKLLEKVKPKKHHVKNNKKS